MPTVESRARALLVCRIALVCVIASLCFSVGEGLRLTPFPVTTLSGAEANNSQLNLGATRGKSQNAYGPVAMPMRVQQRGKCQIVEFGTPPAQDSRELIAHQVLLRNRGESANFDSTLFRSPSTGRAPPFVS